MAEFSRFVVPKTMSFLCTGGNAVPLGGRTADPKANETAGGGGCEGGGAGKVLLEDEGRGGGCVATGTGFGVCDAGTADAGGRGGTERGAAEGGGGAEVVLIDGTTSFAAEEEGTDAAEGRGGRLEGPVVLASLEAEDPGKREAKLNPLVVVGTALLVEEGRGAAATVVGSELDLVEVPPFDSFSCDDDEAPVVGLGGRPLGFVGDFGFVGMGFRDEGVPFELDRGRGGRVAGEEAKRELATFSVRA